MEALGINFKLILAQIINFGLFFFIFKKFVAGPFLDFIAQEKKKEQEKQRILEELKQNEEKMKAEETKFRQNLRTEMEKILSNARQSGEKVREELIAAAKKEIVELERKHQRQMRDEKDTLHKEIRAKIVDLSVTIINEALKKYLTDDSKKSITQYILRNFHKEDIKYEN